MVRATALILVLLGGWLLSACVTSRTAPSTPNPSADLSAASETLVSVPSRGLTQSFIFTPASDSAVANVMLLAGGHGHLTLSQDAGSVRIGWGKNNFLLRSRALLAAQGLNVAALDSPSDSPEMSALWRMGPAHSDDIQAVADFLKRSNGLPTWVIGTSMGSFSAANAGIRLANHIDGVVLSSSVTLSREHWSIVGDYPNAVLDMPLSEVTMPVLLVAHQDDACPITPPHRLDELAAALSQSKRLQKRLFSGGLMPIAKPCKALSQHGYYGIESEVVNAIVNFVKH